MAYSLIRYAYASYTEISCSYATAKHDVKCRAHSCALSRLKKEFRMQLGENYTRCEPGLLSGYCQAGLTRAHINAWRRIVNSGQPAAWVLE